MRTPVRTCLQNSQVHGNTRSEGTANARKKCSNKKYIGSRRRSGFGRDICRRCPARDISCVNLEAPHTSSRSGRAARSFDALRGGEANDRYIAIEHTHHPALSSNVDGGACCGAFDSGANLLLPGETRPLWSP